MTRHLWKLLFGFVLAIGLAGCGGGGGDDGGGSSSPTTKTGSNNTSTAPASLVGTTIRFTDHSGTHYYQYNFRANGYGNYDFVGTITSGSMGCKYAYQQVDGNTIRLKAWDYIGTTTSENSYNEFEMKFQTASSGTYSVTVRSPNLGTSNGSGSFQIL